MCRPDFSSDKNWAIQTNHEIRDFVIYDQSFSKSLEKLCTSIL